MRTAEPVRVVQLLHTIAYGGVETAILNWLAAFCPSDVDARVVVFANPDQSEKAFITAADRAGVKVSSIPWGRSKPVIRSARRLAEYIRRERIEVLHCHNTYANVVGLLAAKMAGVRVLTTYYVWGNFSFKRNALQKIDEWLMRRFDQVSAHCEQCYKDTLERGADPHRLHLLVCGYPAKSVRLTEEARVNGRKALGAAPDETVFVYMARFWPEKAHENLLYAFRRVVDQHPRSRLWLPGVGPCKEAAESLSRQLGFASEVSFLGFHPDPDLLLALSDIQVHPSDNEGVALAICAGMAAARPIIASRVGGLEEVLKHDKSAILIPPRDPQRLAEEMLGLIRNPDRAQALGREARRFIQEEYSAEAAAGRVHALYQHMVGRAAS